MREHPRRAESHGPEIPADPTRPATLVEALLAAAETAPGAGVLVTGPREEYLSYPDLLARARRLLGGLRAHGVRPGDHALLQVPDLAEFFPAFWACLLGGITPVVLARPAAFAAGDPVFDKLQHTRRVLGGPVTLSSGADAAALDALDVRTLAGAPADPHPARPGGVALLQLSSGSTSTSKVIPLTHRGLVEMAYGQRGTLDVRPDDTLLNWMPLDHSGGLLLYHVGGVCNAVRNAHAPTSWILEDPTRWLDLLDRLRVTHSWAPNFAYRLLADTVAATPGRAWDLSAVRRLVSGGERVTVDAVEGFLAATGPHGIRRSAMTAGWGMAETCTGISFAGLTGADAVHRVRTDTLDGALAWAGPDEEHSVFFSVGPPEPGAALRIVGPDGDPLTERRIGRLQVRGARVTPGYLGDEGATREAFPGGDGWLDTGDLAFMHRGRIAVTGRRKDVVVLNGDNHYCHDIEAAASVPGVLPGEVAACGIPDDRTGTEELAVFYAADRDLAAEIRAAVAGRLRVMVAHVVRLAAAEFPRTTSGKLRRNLLPSLLDRPERRSAGAHSEQLLPGGFPAPPVAIDSPTRTGTWAADPPDTAAPDAGAVRRVVRAVFGPVDPRTPFQELGLGSVQLVALRARLSTALGREVAQTALFAHPTVETLTAHLTGDVPPAPATSTVTADRRIAIIGLACRFPDADDPDTFWANLLAGRQSVRPPADRLAPAFAPLADIASFDAALFGVSAKEAELLDPQHRLFLEVCHEALEHAGRGAPEGHRVGVYAGSGMHLHPGPSYAALLADRTGAEHTQAVLGTRPDFLASRVAYRLGLTGPAIGVQTACSTSLVAVHLAVQGLLAGDADLALAGAAAVHIPGLADHRHEPGSILSATGACRPFDAAADGTVGGDGVAAVLLKPLASALADGDTVYGVLLGTAVNNDGATKVGYAAPSVSGQVDVIRRAQRAAGVRPADIGYVEAHATGTALGDPIEHAALAEAYAGGSAVLGSVKANIGHLDSCAGMAGLFTALLTLRHGRHAPQVCYTAPNPALDLDSGPFRILPGGGDWPAGAGPRRAAVSALGVGGTNAHVILEEPPADGVVPSPTGEAGGIPGDAGTPGVLPLSARTPRALRESARRHAAFLEARPEVRLADLVVTAGAGRRARTHRIAVVGESPAELARGLRAFLATGGPEVADRPVGVGPGRPVDESVGADGPVDVLVGVGGAVVGPGRAVAVGLGGVVVSQGGAVTVGPGGEVVVGSGGPVAVGPGGVAGGADGAVDFVFTGQGVEVGPVGDLGRHPAAARLLDRIGRAHLAATGTGLDGRPADHQPALLARQLTLVELLRAAGIRPAKVFGHSLGEYAALVTAGALSVEDAVALTVERDRLLRGTGPGGMLTVFAARPVVDALLDRVDGLDLAAVNGTALHAVSGGPAALERAEALLDADGTPHRRMAVDRAFHSALLDPVLDGLRTAAGRVAFRPTVLPVISSLGTEHPVGWTPDAAHLVRQAREPVRFDLAVRRLADPSRVVLEIGPRPALVTAGRALAPDLTWVASQPKGRPALAGLWRSAAELWCAGVPVDWVGLTAGHGARRIALPGYPYERRRYWPAPLDTVEVAPMLDVLDRVRALTAAQLGLPVAEVGADSTFFALGADSLLLVAMVREVREGFGVRIGVRELFEDIDTPRRLGEVIVERSGGSDGAGSPGGRDDGAPEEVADPMPSNLVLSDPVLSSSVPSDPVPAGPGAGTEPVRAPDPAAVDPWLRGLIDQQLALMHRQLDLVGGTASLPAAPEATPVLGRPETAPVPVPPPIPGARDTGRPAPGTPPGPGDPGAPPARTDTSAQAAPPHDGGTIDLSLYFFGDYPEGQADGYGPILAAAEFADRNGLHAVWIPERHFHSFGGVFPNPSVLAAAIAARTSRVRINAGSVVLPLHHPVRVAEEWSMVDNLSGGRIGLGCASGWHADDFVFFPDHYGRHREVMWEHLDTVRRLWRGERVAGVSGSGAPIEVGLFPRPVQAEPPVHTAILGNPDSYRQAARRDVGVVTNLMAQSVAELAANIAGYRAERRAAGLGPGRVTVLVHTYLAEDAGRARAEAFEPFCGYLRSSLSLLGQVANSLGMNIDLDAARPEDVAYLLERAYDRYCAERALIGSPDSVAPVLAELTAAGVDEIACFIDFGLPADRVAAGLPHLAALALPPRPTGPALLAHPPQPTGPAPLASPPRPTGQAPSPPARNLVAAPATPPPAMDAGPTAPSGSGAPGGADAGWPLAPGQRRLWLADQLGQSHDYNEAVAIRLAGPLDADRLADALATVVGRHAPLRTAYREVDGEPRQFPRDSGPALIVVNVEDEEAAVAAAMAEESRRRFDLAAGQVCAFRLLRSAPGRHVLILSFHHIGTDGSSYHVFSRELSAAYRGADLPDLPTTYPDWAAGQPPAAAKDLGYWVDQLTPVPAPLALPRADGSRERTEPTGAGNRLPAPPEGDGTHGGRSVFLELPAGLADQVRAFGHTERATVFSTLLAAFGVAVHRMTGQREFVVGTGLANRDEGTAGLIGFFVATLPLVVRLDRAAGFRDLVRQVRGLTADAHEHGGVSFDEIVRAVNPPRVPGRGPLFDVAVEFEGEGAFALDLPGVTATPLPVGLSKAPVPLMVYLSHGATVRAHVEYQSEVFSEETVLGLWADFGDILGRALAEPGLTVAELAGDRDGVGPPEPEGAPELGLVRRVFAAELGRPVGDDESFFELGGHSLLAVRVANRLRAAGLTVSPADVLARPTARALADGLRDTSPATLHQAWKWRLLHGPEPVVTHIALRWDLRGDLDEPALRGALDALVARHPALRTRIFDQHGVLTQEPLPARPVDLATVRVEPGAVDDWAVAVGRRPFDVDGGRMLHAELARVGPDRWCLALVVQHLVADGWSMELLVRELAGLYTAAVTGRAAALEPVAATFQEHARRQVGTDWPRGYWARQLADAPPPVPAARSGRGAEHHFTVPADLVARLVARHGPGLYPVLAVAHVRLSGRADTVFAMPYAMREHMADEGVVGLYYDPLPIRVRAGDTVARVRRTVTEAMGHARPILAVFGEVRPGWRIGEPQPFATETLLLNAALPEVTLPGLVAGLSEQPLGGARRDHAVMFRPWRGGLAGTVEYSTDVSDADGVADRCARLLGILEELTGTD
ncbi:MupA/Atu3671 family FMN-dependent luciferase-like monooxygenase [Longispora sp. NPDC051575]|uniref:MupA/Atu3671 family FMN-dependent luciferase-like monooxygenase n=1 Tax=Longispora sp. NPDC051575 TaxID=3154943 RepID=UPI0034165FCE